MLAAERPIEAQARTVKCPNCGARPKQRCRYKVRRFATESEYSHTGRLEKARAK